MKYLFWYKVVLYKDKYPNSGAKEILIWDNLSFEVRNKWQWYFEYRAALLKVNNPRSLVENIWGKSDIDESTPISLKINSVKKRITVVKQLLTKHKNLLSKYKETESGKLFPDINSARFKSSLQKIKNEETELIILEKELNELRDKL